MKRITMAAGTTCLALAVAAPLSAHAAGLGSASPAPSGPASVAVEKSRVADMTAALHLGSGEALQVKTVVSDRDGTTHVRYERTFQGLRVVGGDFVAHRNGKGALAGTSGRASVAVASTSASLSRSAAASKVAVRDLKAASTTTELVVLVTDHGPRLAYDILRSGVRADQTPSRLHTFVDARNGKVLDSWDEIADGTGHGIHVGDVTLSTSGAAPSYQLKNPTTGAFTTDLNGATKGTGTQFTDADDVWGNGSTTDRQSAAVDAQYGADKTYDYYSNVLGRRGIWDTGKGAPSRVHYGDAYVNAFWDGTQMTYGDGINNANPLTSLDVSGHEMSHGVTENTAGLVYRGDAGGLNEATSDIFGTAVEWNAANASDPGDYLIGEEINIRGDGKPLRYMDQPSKDGKSRDCWDSTVKKLDPHYSSGPLNHWFFLASEGSGAKTVNGVAYNSPTCDGSTVTGVGRDAAEKVWYRALSVYLTKRSDYPAARDAAIKSAKDLYGAGSAQSVGVAKAFDAIGVPKQAETP
ncbi:M4 family metallopeptidase [Luteipulveratus sp. YIM 133132]|uniref:M4 family metallopeptidase n=1 Tax=Luteipulveratus flavus TaxID=3031728 RepID=UPI0023AF20D2|nr:M4 family metallopeptidase [Luteipulveratus sp. YIM 133132]MDE9367126.1 M4 family metallopeptidase [Luteipulveratus sp. YIM 133132]